MMIENIDSVILGILGLWGIFVSWRIFSRIHMKCFLLIGLSIVFLFLSIPLSNITKKIFEIVSDILFWAGAIMLGTVEFYKIKELGKTTKIIDVLLGRIPTKVIYGEAKLTSFEKVVFIISSSLLIVYSVINYFILHGSLQDSLPMLIVGLIFILYSSIPKEK